MSHEAGAVDSAHDANDQGVADATTAARRESGQVGIHQGGSHQDVGDGVRAHRRTRSVLPAVGVLGALALAVVLSPVVHPRQPTSHGVATSALRSVVCPPLQGGTFIAGVGPGRASLGILGGSSRTISQMVSEPAGTSVRTLTPQGGDQPVGGVLAAGVWAGCRAPAAHTSLALEDAASNDLLLVNPDATAVSVNLTFLGTNGPRAVAGARGIVVQPRSSRTVPLSVLVGRGGVGIDVQTDSGRVVALARPLTASAPGAVPGQSAASVQVVPGLPAGSTHTTVRLTNPGEVATTVSVAALTSTGWIALAGAQGVGVPAQSSVAVDLTRAVAGEAMSLQVVADHPVVASAVVTPRGGSGARFIAGQAPAQQHVLVAPRDGTLVVADPGSAGTTVQVVVTTKGVAATTSRVVRAGGQASVSIPAGALVHVSASQDVVAALVTDDGITVNAPMTGSAGSVALQDDPTLH